MGTKLLRLVSALFAFAIVASACGGETVTESASEAASVVQDAATNDDVVDGEDATEDEASHDDHEAEEDSHAHDEVESHDEHSHSDVLEVNADAAVPGIEIELTESDVSGVFDIAVTLTNFTINEEAVDGEPVDNEGHLHLYLDGERVERFFDLNHQVTVPEGEHVIEVELSSNSHAPYAVDGVPIRAAATIVGAGAVVEPVADLAVAAVFASGSVTLDADERIEASVGDVVTLTIDSDVAEEIHLHGYDIFADVVPGETTTMTFTADTPGRFEIEFETSHAFIAELVVS